MATIQEQINQLKVDKQTLVDNLVAKGVEATSDETFTTLVPKVNDIQSGGDISEYFNITYSGTSPNNWIRNDFIKKLPDLIINDNVTSLENFCASVLFAPKIVCNSNVTYMAYLYSNNSSPIIDVSGLNTSNVFGMTGMFQSANFVVSLDLTTFDTSKVKNFINMFYYCNNLTNLNISNWNVSNVESTRGMFYGCGRLTNLDLSNWNLTNVNEMTEMFSSCSKLTSLDLSGFVTTKVKNMTSMFFNCRALTRLDIRNFDFTNVTSYNNMFNNVPTDCLIIVKDDTAKEWITSKFTTLTNVKTVAELEAA